MLQVTSASIVSWVVFCQKASRPTFHLELKAVCAGFRPVNSYPSDFELEIRVVNQGKGGSQVLLHMKSKTSEMGFWAMRIGSKKASSRNTWLKRAEQEIGETLLKSWKSEERESWPQRQAVASEFVCNARHKVSQVISNARHRSRNV